MLKYLIFMQIIVPAFLDCGCNKLDRGKQKLIEQNIDESLINLIVDKKDEKVCENREKNQNTQYRDYYKEPEDMALINGGSYLIGTDQPHFHADKESPERLVKINDFYLDKYEVSNKEFKKFVDSQNYTTEAEKFGDSFIFKTLLSNEMQNKYHDFRVVNANWWFKVKGVFWRKPNGPNTNLKGKY